MLDFIWKCSYFIFFGKICAYNTLAVEHNTEYLILCFFPSSCVLHSRVFDFLLPCSDLPDRALPLLNLPCPSLCVKKLLSYHLWTMLLQGSAEILLPLGVLPTFPASSWMLLLLNHGRPPCLSDEFSYGAGRFTWPKLCKGKNGLYLVHHSYSWCVLSCVERSNP